MGHDVSRMASLACASVSRNVLSPHARFESCLTWLCSEHLRRNTPESRKSRTWTPVPLSHPPTHSGMDPHVLTKVNLHLKAGLHSLMLYAHPTPSVFLSFFTAPRTVNSGEWLEGEPHAGFDRTREPRGRQFASMGSIPRLQLQHPQPSSSQSPTKSWKPSGPGPDLTSSPSWQPQSVGHQAGTAVEPHRERGQHGPTRRNQLKI